MRHVWYLGLTEDTVVLRNTGVSDGEIPVKLVRHAKITAAWTAQPPDLIPLDELTEGMVLRS
jgi:hypothetical protein